MCLCVCIPKTLAFARVYPNIRHIPAFKATIDKEQNVKLTLRVFISMVIAMLFTLSMTGYAHGRDNSNTEIDHTEIKATTSVDSSHIHPRILTSSILSADEYLKAYVTTITTATTAYQGPGYQGWCKRCACHLISCSESDDHVDCCNGLTCGCIMHQPSGCTDQPAGEEM